MTYYALVSPQGHVEYNARFVLGDRHVMLEPGKWYTPQELADITGRALFARDSPNCVEKNIKRWRYEVQP